MKRNPELTRFSISYNLIIGDLMEIFEFISPHKKNLNVFSSKIYSLFLRSCTEFENLCKFQLALKRISTKRPEDYKISDYKLLIQSLNLFDKGTKLYHWEDKTDLTIYPFKEFHTSESITWYRDYNKVKHNYREGIEKANLENLIYSIAGLTITGWTVYNHKYFYPLAKSRFISASHNEILPELSIFSFID